MNNERTDGLCTECGIFQKCRCDDEQARSGLSDLLCVLADISGMCVGEIAMGYRLDAQSIGEMIYEATGMTQPELAEYAKKTT